MPFVPPPLEALEPDETTAFTPPPLDSLESEESSTFMPPSLDSLDEEASAFEAFKKEKAARDKVPFHTKVIEGAGAVASTVGSGIKELASSAINHPLDTLVRIPSTVAEGAAKGTADLINLPIMTGRYGVDLVKSVSQTPEEELRSDFERQKFNENLQETRNDFTQIPGALPQTSEMLSLALDPSAMASAGAGSVTKGALKSTLLKGAAGGAELVETGAKGVARGAEVLNRPFEALSKATEGTVFPIVGKSISVPLKTAEMVPTTVAKTTEFVKEALDKSAKPSQVPVLTQIAADRTISPIVRKSAQLLSYTPTEPILKTVADFTKGGVTAATTGGALSLVTGQDVGEGVGGGMFIGGMGYIGGKLKSSGKRFKEAQTMDRQSFEARHNEDAAFNSIDLDKIPEGLRQKAADMELFGGGKFEIRFVDNAKAKELGVTGQGYYQLGRGGVDQILINADKVLNGESTIAHEVGHSVYNSPSLDKSSLKALFQATYGDEGVLKRQREYSRQDLSKKMGVREDQLTSSEVDHHLNDLNTQRGPDWIYSELFSEHFADLNANRGLREITAKTKTFTSIENLKRDTLIAMQPYMMALGIPLKRTGQIDPVFRKNPLSQDPKVRNAIQNYQRAYSDYQVGISNIKPLKETDGVLLSRDQFKGLDSFKLSAGDTENALYFLDERGITREKSMTRLKKERLERDALVKNSIYNKATFAPEAVSDISRRTTGDVTGKLVADRLENAGIRDTNFIKNAEVTDAAIQGNRPISFTYVAKTLDQGGDIRISARNFLPLGYKVTKKGRVYAGGYDMDYLANQAHKLQLEDKLGLWDGSAQNFLDDIKQVGQDHFKGKFGGSTVGEKKYGFIRGVLGFDNSNADPDNAPKGGMYRSFYVDQMVKPKQTGDAFAMDYYKMKHGAKP